MTKLKDRVPVDMRPGLNAHRLISLIRESIQRCELNLQEMTVVTEAATGAYAVTPVMAAIAGARRVFALGRDTRFGTIDQIRQGQQELARLAGVGDRIEFTTKKSREIFAQANIVTNSGHVRPIDAEVVNWMRRDAVIPLMYEAWELRPGDIDLAACRRRGIALAGTNESHPAINVFSFLGAMAIKLLHDSGVAACGSRVLLLCDNPFAPYMVRTLQAAGSFLDVAHDVHTLSAHTLYDALLVAMRPRVQSVIGGADTLLPAEVVAKLWPGAVVAQFWGDLNRDALASAGVPYWPRESPAIGHMGILPSAIGPEPIVRLQAGGLKVGEVMVKAGSGVDRTRCAVESGYGQSITPEEGPFRDFASNPLPASEPALGSDRVIGARTARNDHGWQRRIKEDEA